MWAYKMDVHDSSHLRKACECFSYSSLQCTGRELRRGNVWACVERECTSACVMSVPVHSNMHTSSSVYSRLPVICFQMHKMYFCISNCWCFPPFLSPLDAFLTAITPLKGRNIQFRYHQVVTPALDYPRWLVSCLSVTSQVLLDQTLLHRWHLEWGILILGRNGVGGVAIATAHPPSVCAIWSCLSSSSSRRSSCMETTPGASRPKEQRQIWIEIDLKRNENAASWGYLRNSSHSIN